MKSKIGHFNINLYFPYSQFTVTVEYDHFFSSKILVSFYWNLKQLICISIENPEWFSNDYIQWANVKPILHARFS